MLALLPTTLAVVIGLFSSSTPSFGLDFPAVAWDQEPTRQEKQLDKKEKQLREVELQRDNAFQALRDEYAQLEALWLDQKAIASEPSSAIISWLTAQQLTAADWPQQLKELRAAGPCHEWWNDHLYLHSKAASNYADAVQSLEEAFFEVEQLRHPERFVKGFDQAPPGMILVPGDRFPLGPHTGRTSGFPNSLKERVQKLKSFYLDRTEVSCQDYWKFLLAQPTGMRPQHLPLGWKLDGQDLPVIPEAFEEAPVTGVSWNSAAAYARWAGRRLPTEQEWEAAAAGTEQRTYPSGERYDALEMNCLATRIRGVRPPQQFNQDRTPLGLLCMGGNASEWTGDLYLTYTDLSKRAKKVNKARAEVEAVVRGGSYLSSAEGCRNNYRQLYPALGRQYRHVGFRYALDAP